MREEKLRKGENGLSFILGAGAKTLKQGRYVLASSQVFFCNLTQLPPHPG